MLYGLPSSHVLFISLKEMVSNHRGNPPDSENCVSNSIVFNPVSLAQN